MMTTTHKQGRVILAWLILTFLLSSCASTYTYKGGELDPPLLIPNFELTDTSGEAFQLSDTEDKLTLVYFGYTFCPDVCPLTLWDVKQSLEGLVGREQVQTVFISVDPERDTPAALADYVSAFDPTFIGLTDDETKTQEVLSLFGAEAHKEFVENSSTHYLVSHTTRLYLLTPGRNLQLTYPYGFAPEDLRADLAHLLAVHNLN